MSYLTGLKLTEISGIKGNFQKIDSPTPELSIINGLDHDYQVKHLNRIFEENADLWSCRNKSAVIFNSEFDDECIFTYKQLNQAANRMAALLIDHIQTHKLKRNGDGDWIVAVCMPPSHELIVTLLAIWKAGAAYLPIDVTFPKNRIDHILQDAQPTLIIYDSDLVDSNLFTSPVEVLSFANCKALSANYNDANISNGKMLQRASGSRIALILYTSGSSGVPKGVRIPHTAVLNRLQWQWKTFPYSSTEKICVFKTALTFVDSVSEIWSPLLMKKTLLIIPKVITTNPEKLVTVLEQHKIERLVLVPTLLKSILIFLSLRKGKSLLNRLKLWICSGESLPITLADEFYEYFPENKYLLCNFYGSTEIMGDATYYICRGKKQLRAFKNNVPIGKPISNTTVYILDKNGQPVEMGDTGELFVSGTNLAHGYVNGRENDRFIGNIMATDPVFSRMYRTGDYASIQIDGVIQYEGRTDSQIKVRGHRVDLNEIGKQLLKVNDVKKEVVLCYHAGQMDQAILAFVCIETKTSIDALQIERLLSSKIPEYMIPQVIIVDDIPLLVNGKIDRQFLLNMYDNSNNNDDDEIEFDFSEVQPNEIRKAMILFETVSEVIGKSAREIISLNSNFYALGGNSMNSIYTIAKLRDRGFSIDITSFIKATNLGEILSEMKDVKGKIERKCSISIGNELKLAVEPLKMEHQDEAVHIIAHAQVKKNKLWVYLKPAASYSEFVEVYNGRWKHFVEDGHSFIIKDENNRIIGIKLNYDVHEMHGKTETPKLQSFQIHKKFVNAIEDPIIAQTPKDKVTLYSSLLVTHERLDAKENVMLTTFMENETIRLANEKLCCGILTRNTNPVTQQLAVDVFGYETILDYQINQYITKDGEKPFGSAPDSDRAIMQWKQLE